MQPGATRSLRDDLSSANCSRRWASSTLPSNTTAPVSRLERFISGPAPATGHALACCTFETGSPRAGQRLLPVGWADNSARLTPQSADEYGYGAGFWTQRGNSAAARKRIAAGIPADSFMAIGSQGQYTIVIPSHDLVIVKIGWAYTPHDDHVAVERLVRETITALPSEIRGR
jgi:hypothetical protein